MNQIVVIGREGPVPGMVLLQVKNSRSPADTPRMYRCHHCASLHFASAQARRCLEYDLSDDKAFLAELIHQGRQGRLPWPFKYEARRSQPVTESEAALQDHLSRAIGSDTFRREWWLDELDYRVDFLVEAPRLVIEVDGPSHNGREARDLVRALRIRDAGYEVARATADDVLARGEHIASQIAFRVHAALAEASEAGEAA